MKSSVVKGLKEAGRLVIFALPGILIEVITNDPTLSSGWGLIILTALKSIDRSIHDSPSSAKGILPF